MLPPSSFYRGASEVIFEAHDVVFAEVVAALDFDEDESITAGILDAVRGTEGDVNRLAERDDDLSSVECHFGRAANDHPMLGAARVLLITQTLSRRNFDTLYFVIASLIEDGE